MINWADIVYLIWDNRSSGTIFDFGMCFALNKPVRIEYIESKTFEKLMKQYAHTFDDVHWLKEDRVE